MSQRSAGKRPRYNMDASDDEDGAAGCKDEQSSDAAGGSNDDDSDTEQQQRPRKKLARSSQGAGRGAQAGMSQQMTDEDGGDGIEDDEGRKSPAATPARWRPARLVACKDSDECTCVLCQHCGCVWPQDHCKVLHAGW